MEKNKSLINDVKVSVNCLTAYPNELVNKDDYQHLVNLVKSYKQTDEWAKTPKPDYDYYEGRRYHDDDRVAGVIYGNIRLSINKYLGGTRFVDDTDNTYELFGHYIKLIDDNKWKEWINAALLYSAGSDHWYTFEKDWS